MHGLYRRVLTPKGERPSLIIRVALLRVVKEIPKEVIREVRARLRDGVTVHRANVGTAAKLDIHNVYAANHGSMAT